MIGLVTKEHDEFEFNSRFGPGLPRINDGALLFLLHMISKMRPYTTPVSRRTLAPASSADGTGAHGTGASALTANISTIRDHCEAYLEKEVLPYRDDAWIDHTKIKLGYEIPFNRHFYEYEEPRPLKKIEKEIKGLEVMKTGRGSNPR